MSRHTFKPTNRGYAAWFYDPPCGDISLSPLEEKLLVGDIVTSSNVIDRCSRYRAERSIPGVLCLSRGTHGRRNGRQLYRCVPADPLLPVFLVPYTQKKPEFGKAAIDLYILFEFVEWTDKHPVGSSTNTLGKVSDLGTTFSYLTHAAGLHHPIQKLTRHVFNALRAHPNGACGLETELELVLPPAQPGEWGDLITIDPPGAMDLDDAVSAVRLPDSNGFRVSVCITDPTYWLERLGLWGMLTDRTTTLYLPDAKRPMLPSNLSEGLCSLQVGKPRAALVLWVQLDQGGATMESGFRAGSVCIKHNYVYEEAALKSCATYTALCEATQLAQSADPLLDQIVDSHDVVAYWMMKYNLLAAEALSRSRQGIYRTAPRQPVREPAVRAGLPEDTQRLLRYWGAEGGEYTGWAGRSPHGAIGDGKRLYVQATSPIRRLCDLVNTAALIRACGLRAVEAGCDEHGSSTAAFLEKWTGRVHEIQLAGKAARRLQADCELLNLCIREKGEGYGGATQPEYDGYPIARRDRPAYSIFCFRYTVHIPALRNLVRVDTDEDWTLLVGRKFTLHLFVEESTLSRKVRVAAS